MTADAVYVDPSALSRLYLNQSGSREMHLWRARAEGNLPVTHHGRTELVNAVALAVFRAERTPDQAIRAWANMEADFRDGHLVQVDLLWRAALNRAAELSRTCTPTLGTRALDVLHVACALELKMKHFLTFDERQKKLASACGLKLVKL
ncbi:MAG: type II toxin-antitoxin system VapC family toxin [Verrucomicrobiota bacterium]